MNAGHRSWRWPDGSQITTHRIAAVAPITMAWDSPRARSYRRSRTRWPSLEAGSLTMLGDPGGGRRSAGDVEDQVRVRGKELIKELHELRRVPDYHLHTAPPRLLPHVVGDRQPSVGSRPDPELPGVPGNLLGSGQRCVTELLPAGLRRTLLSLADPSAGDDHVMLVANAIDRDLAEFVSLDAHGFLQQDAGSSPASSEGSPLETAFPTDSEPM